MHWRSVGPPRQNAWLSLLCSRHAWLASSAGATGCSQQSVCSVWVCVRTRDVMHAHYATDKEAGLDRVTRVEPVGN